MTKISTFATLAIALAVSATPVAARVNTDRSVTVSYADLNLGSKEGRQALDRRLARAATHVCGGRPDMRNMQANAAFRDCLAQTRQGYQDQRLAAIEAARQQRVAVVANALAVIAVR